MNAGDVVVRFIGDTSQLDQSFNSVAVQQQQAAQAAGAAALELKAAQKELRLSMQATQAQGGLTEGNMQRLADAEQRVALAGAEAAEAQAALKMQLGIGAENASLMSEAVGEVSHHLGGMLALMAVAEGVKSWVEHVQEGVLALANLSTKTGVNITTLAGLEQVAEKSGVEFKVVETALIRMQNAQVLAVEGSTKQIQAFRNIGVSVAELKTLSPEQLFFRIGEELGKSGKHALDTNTAMTLFGRGASDLNVIFKDFAGHLRETVDEEGKMTGVTKEAGQAAKSWQSMMADLDDTLKANTIPILEALIPVFKVVMSAGSFAALGIRMVASAVGGLAIAAAHEWIGFGEVMDNVSHGKFKDAADSARRLFENVRDDVTSIKTQWDESAEITDKTMDELWRKKIPEAVKSGSDTLGDFAGENKKATQDAAQEAKTRLDAVVASIEAERAKVKLMLQEKLVSIKQASDAELALTEKERAAKEQYFDELVALYKKAGNAAKVKETEDQRAADRSKASTAAINATTEAEKKLEEETKKYGATANSVLGNVKEKTEEMLTPVELMEKNWRTFIPQWVQDSVKLTHALEGVGVEGLDKMRQKLNAAEKAEALLNKSGIHDGEMWLKVQKAKLESMVAIERAEATNAGRGHRRATQTEKDLDEINRRLKRLGTAVVSEGELFDTAMQGMQQSVGQFSTDIGVAFAAVIQGQLSVADAVLQSVGKMIGAMCDHWAQYFMAMAIADMFGNPAKAAAELAAAAALKMAGALAGSLGSAGSSSKGSEDHPVIDTNNPAGQSGPNPVGGRNVPRMAAGGLVTSPTLLMAGDARMGGASSNAEGILPLGNRDAMDAIASAIAARMGGVGTTINVTGLISGDELSKLVRKIDRQISRRQARLTAGNSFRVTPRG